MIDVGSIAIECTKHHYYFTLPMLFGTKEEEAAYIFNSVQKALLDLRGMRH
jgi:hypothetical protein